MFARLLETTRGRLLAFSLLYLSEGIPWGFSAVALVAYLRGQGLGVAEIGAFTAALYAPWAFKWAWAPLVDLVRPRRFGPSRTWIVGSQALMMLSMAALLVFDIEHDVKLLTTLIVVHNIFAATQDVAIDGLAVRVLPDNELGRANGFMFGSQYLGQAIGGSGALFVAGALGFRASFAFVLGAMAILLFGVSLRIQEPEEPEPEAQERGSVLAHFVRRLGVFLQELRVGLFRSGVGPAVGVLFAVLPMGAMALGLALQTTIQVDLGLDESRIATITLMTTIAAAVGCVGGGAIADRIGHRRAIAVFYTLTTIPVFYLASRFSGEGVEGVSVAVYTVCAVSSQLAFGLQYGANTAIFMGLTRKVVAATMFTGYMALHNVVYSYSSLWQGWVAEHQGYARALTLDGLLAFVPLLLLPWLKRPRSGDEPSTESLPPSPQPMAPAQGP